MKETRFVVRADPDFHRQVKVKAAQEGVDISQVIRNLLARWVRGELKVSTETSK